MTKKVALTIKINVTSDRVIAAFTNPEMLKGWWGVERSLIELKPGGNYTLAWDITEKGFGYVSSGIVKEYIPVQLLEIEKFVYLNPDKAILGPMKLMIKASENNGISDVYICQDGYQTGGDWDWYYDAVKNAWPQAAEILKNYLEKDN